MRIEKHKTKKKKGVRFSGLPDYVASRIRALISGIDPDMYVFGKKFKPERRDKPVHGVIASRRWKALVKEGLGINKDLYAGKGTKANKKLSTAEDLEAMLVEISAAMGHSNTATTKRHYATEYQLFSAVRQAQTADPFVQKASLE